MKQIKFTGVGSYLHHTAEGRYEFQGPNDVLEVTDVAAQQLLKFAEFADVTPSGVTAHVTATTNPPAGGIEVVMPGQMLVFGTGAPLNGDGRPDGTVYIQIGV